MRRDAVGFAITLDVEGKSALVVGGGAEAADKVERLLDGGALVTVLAKDPEGAIASLGARGRITLLSRDFFAADVREADLVLICTPDRALADQAALAADEAGAALWVNDVPERSQFAMPALARAGKLRLAISTAGAAPALASKIRSAIERDLDAPFRAFVEKLAIERKRLLAEEPDAEKRRAALLRLVDEFELKLTYQLPTG